MADEDALEDQAAEAAEATEATETDGDDDSGDEPKKKKKDPKKLIMFGVIGLVGLIIVGGGAAFMLGALDGLLGIEREKTKLEIDLGVPVRHPLPVIKSDLKTGKCRSPFLRVELVVQLNKDDVSILEEKNDEVLDAVRTHLRDQERQDLVGKAGSDKLRFDLINIINNVIKPARVHGVLFKEFLLQ